MSDFRTKITPQKFPFEISHSDKIMLIGSCFSENIGRKLVDLKFDILNNPYGILFNPISIFNSINEIIDQSEHLLKSKHWEKLQLITGIQEK